jgi:hypothetical protein
VTTPSRSCFSVRASLSSDFDRPCFCHSSAFHFPVSLPRRGLAFLPFALGSVRMMPSPFFVRAASGSRTEAGYAKLILHDDPPLKCGGAFP